MVYWEGVRERMAAKKKARRMGRPPRAGEAAERLIRFRATDEEYERIARAAERSGETVSQFLRRIVDAAVSDA